MAGEKLSVRQQMIGMMYLVLTAMLALQVSSSIMDKFIFLESSLEHSLEEAQKASENAIEELEKKVEKGGNSAEGKERIKRAHKLRGKVAEIIGRIEEYKKMLIKAGGGEDSKTGVVKNPKEETAVEVLMIGQNKGGQGYKLEGELNDFVKYLYNDYKDLGFSETNGDNGDFPSLAEGNAKNPIYANDPINKGKDFAEASFGQTPVVAALAVLTQKQNEIVRYEQMVLKKLGADDLARGVKFDKIVALASAESNTVAVGEKYEASMFIAASSSKLKPKMFARGSSVKVTTDKKIGDGNIQVGKVKFSAGGAGESSWKGEIKVNIKGKDTTFKFSKDYTVVKPALIVNSATLNPLYRNCANPLITSVPALGPRYEPSFSVTNGSAVKGGKTGEVTIYPGAGAKSILTVRSGSFSGKQDFDILPVPCPTIKLVSSTGKEINPETPIPGGVNMSVKAKADANFAKALPKEANYKVGAMEIRVFRGGRAITNKRGSGGVIGRLSTRPGDGVQIKVLTCVRINSRGSTEQTKPCNSFVSYYTR